MLDDLLQKADKTQEAALQRLQELLRIKSISTDSAFAEECQKAAQWCSDQLGEIGFDSEVIPTPGHPMVLAHYAGQGPHFLFYGHYDVQPVDPLALWHSDPFDPQVVEGENGPMLRARGASDDKGQLMTFVEACRVIMDETGGLPCSITVFFEGEEESGSPSLLPFLEQYKSRLGADLALICDTGMLDRDTPSIVTQLRGMVQEELTIHGPNKDLHSGMFGGPAINPLRVMSKVLADLHDDNGRVTLDGFYGGVADLDPEQRQSWADISFSGEGFLGDVGLSAAAGEEGYSVLEQIWSRPTCEINGLWGGYTGEGFKTVLPAQAHAKVSFRLVGDQDPDQIHAAFVQHVTARLPIDCSVEFGHYAGDGAATMPIDSAKFTAIQNALSEEWKNRAVFVGCGGSIPVAGHMQSILGVDSALVGFAQDNDAIHSPNEKYDLRSYYKGIRSWIRILFALKPAG